MRGTKPPDWIISITDQEAAESCLPYSCANLICPPLEWEARSGSLFGQDISCSLKFFTPPGDPQRLDAWITFLRPWLKVRMWWDVMCGPIPFLAECRNEWHMARTHLIIESREQHDDLIYLHVASVDGWARTMRAIARVIDDGYSLGALRAALLKESLSC